MTSIRYDGMVPTRCLYFILCLTFLPLIFLISSLFTYIGFGIYFLVEDYEIRDYCPDSYLWEYILTCVIFSPLYIIHNFLKKYTKVSLDIRFRILIYSVIIYLSIVVLGGLSLYDYNLSCESDNEDLWKFGISSFIFQIIYLFYCFIYYLDYILPYRPISPEISSPSGSTHSEIVVECPTYLAQETEI